MRAERCFLNANISTIEVIIIRRKTILIFALIFCVISTASCQLKKFFEDFSDILSSEASTQSAEPSSVSSTNSLENDYMKKITEENESLKRDNENLRNTLDHLKENFDSLAEKYYEVVPTAFFTFDDGPSENTTEILKILKEENIKATFFVVGAATPFRFKMYKEIVDEGHSIGLHAYWHSYKHIYASAENFFNDFDQLEDSITASTGIRPALYRFPGGSNNSYLSNELFNEIASKLKDRGYTYIDWNVDSYDSRSSTPPAEKIVSNVINQCKRKMKNKNKNAVILMHDSAAKETNLQALPKIISSLREMGYSFEPLSTDVMSIQFR